MSIVIITGGSRGLGASIAAQFAKRGMGVILTYNSNGRAAEQVVGTIDADGGKAVAIELDVSKSASFPAFRDTVGELLATTWKAQTFDFLVNNVEYGLYNPIATVTEDEFDGLSACISRGRSFSRRHCFPSWPMEVTS
ncbi:MAG: fabG [Xanthobacteraceae bacterium]|jgi:NAD(P)-dependent dehydrogenase (short-subunit alcohol dehydrogenase family)|nr:fabG [Xanthobacteraceae bacterium]